MLNFVYSLETASSNIALKLRERLELEESARFNGRRCFVSGNIRMLEVEGRLVNAEALNEMLEGDVIFLSRHSSSKGVPAFTVHAIGNWSQDTLLGGRAKALSVSSPSRMLNALKSIERLNTVGIQLSYEATHHGPFMDIPSFFVELGGNEETVNNIKYAALLAKAVADSIDSQCSFDKIAVGIGGTHYPERFSRLALLGKYAFSHIMSKHQLGNIDMLEMAFLRSDIRAEMAVLEWKGIKANHKETILRELNRLGIDYAKV